MVLEPIAAPTVSEALLRLGCQHPHLLLDLL